MSSLFSLQGRVAVVIGGTGELCGAMAEGFASAGAHVILGGRDPVTADARLAKIKAAGGSGEFKAGEATNKADLIRLRDEILAQRGRSTSSSTAPASTRPRRSSRSTKPSSTAS